MDDEQNPTWPYTAEQFAFLCGKYPSRELPQGIIAAARSWVLNSSSALKKPNAKTEIIMLAKWVEKGRKLSFGTAAKKHLADKQKRGVEPPTSIDLLMKTLHKFWREHREALNSLPAGPGPGRPKELAEERFIYEVHKAWPLSKRGEVKGWMAFFCACADPLHERFGLRDLPDKAWGEKLTRAKSRWGE